MMGGGRRMQTGGGAIVPTADGTGERASYHEHPVAPALSPHLVCVWTQRTPPGSGCYFHRVLPDGCVDIVWVGHESPVVAGPATIPIIAPLPPATLVVGARFRPGSAPAWLGCGAWELLNATVPLRDLWGVGAREAVERVAAAGQARSRLAVLQSVLAGRLRGLPAADPVVVEAVRRLATDDCRVGAVARHAGLSPRQVLRRFRDWVGYGPKTLQRVLRLQRLLLLAEVGGDAGGNAGGGTGGGAGLAALAAAAGYADQPHMTRDVAELAGLTPRALMAGGAATLGMSDLFKPAP
jgi:AraC-like DNA-binding protein